MEEIRLACMDDPVSRALAGRARALLEAGRIRPALRLVADAPGNGDPVQKLLGDLAAGAVDLAVFPAERLPVEVPSGVRVAAVLRDGIAPYHRVSRERLSLARLAGGTAVAACDPLARAQLRHRYPRLDIQPVRPGPELVEGVRRGLWAAACAPRALVEACLLGGLDCEAIPAEVVMPPVGQGLLSILVRSGAPSDPDRVARLNERRVEIPWLAERSFMRELGSDPGRVCTASGAWSGGEIDLSGLIAEADGRWLVLDTASAPARYAEILGTEVALACRGLAQEALAGVSMGRAA